MKKNMCLNRFIICRGGVGLGWGWNLRIFLVGRNRQSNIWLVSNRGPLRGPCASSGSPIYLIRRRRSVFDQPKGMHNEGSESSGEIEMSSL